MTGWLTLADAQRKATLEQAAVRSGIQAKAIEKDWWVTQALKALYSTPYAEYCIFKGGTSLSKGWKLIQRFSEDIDIALDPKAFGREYQTAPSHGYVKKLKREGCVFTSTLMKTALEDAFELNGMDAGTVSITADAVRPDLPDKDPQTLFIRYTSLFDPHPYLADEVKMEFGVRSLKEPYATVYIQSILSETFPNPVYNEIPFAVTAVEPRKTLLEKAFLLHEKFVFHYPASLPDDRQSRHLYDIVQLMDTGAGQQVLDDPDFYALLTDHRRHYVRLTGIDYDSLHYHRIGFVPAIELLSYFKIDYEQLQTAMIYGDSHPFEELIRRMKVFNGRFRLIGTGLILDEVIAAAVKQNTEIIKNAGSSVLKLPVNIATPSGETFKCIVIMHQHSKLIFERLDIVKNTNSNP